VDAPAFLANEIGSIFSKLAAYSCSAECLGYPHALFRAHRDIRITSKEGATLRQKLMALLFEMGMSQMEVRMLMQDYHDVLEMKQGI
jgi:NurA-like 5'-3' nuclease